MLVGRRQANKTLYSKLRGIQRKDSGAITEQPGGNRTLQGIEAGQPGDD